MKNSDHKKLPIVYSCSGSSCAAQLANQVALELDLDKLAEMSCISGVGGGVKAMVKIAKSGRTIIALDGCPLKCVENCLEKEGVSAAYHYTLTDFGIQKKYHERYNPLDVPKIKRIIISDVTD
jgi:uncharacterized metal-binding protein